MVAWEVWEADGRLICYVDRTGHSPSLVLSYFIHCANCQWGMDTCSLLGMLSMEGQHPEQHHVRVGSRELGEE